MSKPFGPSYEEAKDGARILKQIEVIRDVMLSAAECGRWLTLDEIHNLTRYPQASISADLRHCRKKRFGSYVVSKRRRNAGGTWEYQISRPQVIVPEVTAARQMSLLA